MRVEVCVLSVLMCVFQSLEASLASQAPAIVVFIHVYARYKSCYPIYVHARHIPCHRGLYSYCLLITLTTLITLMIMSLIYRRCCFLTHPSIQFQFNSTQLST